MDISNKVIAVTGAARGIGQAIALRLAKKGAKLALIDLQESGLSETVSKVEALGAQARVYVCDITNESQVVETFSAITAEYERIDGLVNNAGIMRDGLLIKVKQGKVVDKMSADNYASVVDVHMKGAFLCTREAAASMVEKSVEEGVIVNISSLSYIGNYGQTNYSAAKAGMVSMNAVWAKELGRYNIRSMAIAPGPIKTDMLELMPQAALDNLVAQVSLKRVGAVDNITQVVEQIFENDFLTGSVIHVTGGLGA